MSPETSVFFSLRIIDGTIRSLTMKPGHLIALILNLLFFNTNAQMLKRSTIYLEAGGASFFYSLNYDCLYQLKNEDAISLRAGFMYINTFNDESRRTTGVPVGISYLRRLRKNFLELGITNAAILDRYRSFLPGEGAVSEIVLIPSAKLGIRHQPMHKHLFWNAAIQYSFIFIGDRNRPIQESHSLPMVSLGIGYSFY